MMTLLIFYIEMKENSYGLREKEEKMELRLRKLQNRKYIDAYNITNTTYCHPWQYVVALFIYQNVVQNYLLIS